MKMQRAESFARLQDGGMLSFVRPASNHQRACLFNPGWSETDDPADCSSGQGG